MDSPFQYDLVCLGSGPAGQRAAVQAAKLGRRVAIVEKRVMLGGVCVDTGTIPSKTFREAVLSFSRASQPFDQGSTAGANQRPTAAELLKRVERVVQQECSVIENQLRRNGVELILGHGSFLDPHTLRIEQGDGVRTVTAANVLIATGTHPTPPPGNAPVDGTSVITSDDIVKLTRIPRSLVVVGAGVIGIEYASMFAALGVEVTLVDKRTRPLEFLDAEIVDELIHQMRKRNVTFRSGEAVETLEMRDGAPPKVVVLLESGKRIVTDMVLFSVGRVGATDLIHLENAGIEADDRGRLKVDQGFRTAVPHIFAAGDVIGYPSLAATSSEQGRLAACHALGMNPKAMTTNFPVGIYAIPEISMVGAPEHELTAQKVPYEVGVARYREIARGQILGDDSGFFKMLFNRDDRRLLGVHIIGTGATELLHIGQTVMGLGGGLDYFLDTIFNYPTLAECYKVAALNAANKINNG
ncbi:MAG TPA: Si-specific NAD(P)(+) transhydrogenase [Gemmatimonadales bacterium]|jgi:NAD(P) transhydrogenase|nr:Si-specific NAD(P)(+) transhydrogenase [Gemmatimonadales bacterium]